jgi:hypothetical protein
MSRDYETYKGLPPLAGIASLQDAMKPGLTVEQCVARLKRYHYAFKRLHQIFTARITAEPIYELKSAFSLHAWLCAEHVTAIRTRVAEMREPPLGLEQVPDPNLEIFFDEILAAPTTQELIVGLYHAALPALRDELKRHLVDTNPLTDHPSLRVCRFAIIECDQMIDFGRQAIESLDALAGSSGEEWPAFLRSCLDPTAKPTRRFSTTPYEYDPVPRRDERFIDPYNRGVNAEAFLYNPEMPASAKVLMMYFKRLREIDVPEMMASIIAQTPGKPWGYYRDMSRQLWDEARHALMGEVGFTSLGIDWRTVPITWTWSLNLNTRLTPIERHAVLYFIEQGLMPKTGKRYEWEVGVDSGNPLAALFQDYDWADEVLHSAIGRQWYVRDFDDPKQAIKYGDECWSRVSSDYQQWLDKGLTQHENWWPRVYRQACELAGTAPDPAVLAWHETYATTRADLKELSASG